MSSDSKEISVEITNLPCPVCGTHLEIHSKKMYYCPHCKHVEPINDDDDLDFSAIRK